MKPGRRCSICNHSERAKIEALCAGGNSVTAVARQFEVDRSQLQRHMNGTPKETPHVTAAERSVYLCGSAQVEQLRVIAAAQGGTVLEDLQLGKAMIFKAMADAASVKDSFRLASLAGRFLDFLDALGRRTGEIAQYAGITVNNTTVNITASPQFVRLQRGLMKLCLDHPEIRPDVAAMLAECEAEERRGELIQLEAPRAA